MPTQTIFEKECCGFFQVLSRSRYLQHNLLVSACFSTGTGCALGKAPTPGLWLQHCKQQTGNEQKQT
ncbi:hypothetical protein NDU88_005467 [Pleurodeles waltl]|uniref:Uncharacterized protein n=1 Tax=Pleurodeles waltl TaxID=8319 RepID=A0AAV7PI75_PLEWA|nr:hypothetical protein NDU88_005467 [Pleurodeles waltl]